MRGPKFNVAVLRMAGVVSAIALLAPAVAEAQSPSPQNPTPPITVRQGDHVAQQPFHQSWSIPFNSPDDGEIQVPAGKRLVIEFVSFDASVASDCRVGYISVTTSVGGKSVGHYVPITSHIERGTRNVDAVGQSVKFYADPTTTAYFNFGVAGINCNPSGSMAMSGYLVDAP